MSVPPRGIYEVRGQEVMARLRTLVAVPGAPVYLLTVVGRVLTILYLKISRSLVNHLLAILSQ